MNQQFIEKWVSYLHQSDREMSRIAATKLGSTHNPLVVPDLLQTLTNRPDDVRIAAVRALGEIADANAVPHLIQLLTDSNTMLASAAAESLGQIRDPSAVKPLTEVLKEYKAQSPRLANRGLYMAAIYALQQIGTKEALRAVEQYGS